MSLNIFSQLFGSHEGHVLNSDVDSVGGDLVKSLESTIEKFAVSEGAAELAKLGYPATVQGIGMYVDALIKGEEAATLASLPAPAAVAIETALNEVLTAIVSHLPTTKV